MIFHLIDTFDTVDAARLIVRSGLHPQAVRLDSGDLLVLSREVRRILDEGGLRGTRILASGDLDEWRIANLLRAGAPIDAFGVGTPLSTSEDAPALGGVYKLVEIGDKGRVRSVMKRSPSKATWPGTKQVWRIIRAARATEDIVSLAIEPPPNDGVAVLKPVMSGGRRLHAPPRLAELQERARSMVAQLPDEIRRLDSKSSYQVSQSAGRRSLSDRIEWSSAGHESEEA